MPFAPTGPMFGVNAYNKPIVFGEYPIQHIPVRFMAQLNSAVVSQAIFICPVGQSYQVTSVDEVHGTLGTDAGAVTIQLTKESGTTAAGAGTALQVGSFNLKGTINTVQNGVLITTASAVTLSAGDRLSVALTGTATAVAGVVMTVMMKRLS